MADWVAISSLTTVGGTLALAATTYASVRSSNRSARSAERSLPAELRPLLMQSSPDDAEQRIGFADGVSVRAPGAARAYRPPLDGELELLGLGRRLESQPPAIADAVSTR